MNRSRNRQDNWFQQNPRKTLFLVVLISLLLVVAGAETHLKSCTIARASSWKPRSSGDISNCGNPGPWQQMRLRFPKNYLPYTDNAFPKIYRVDIDANGFIKPSQKYLHPDLALVFLGGSTTECMFMDEENRFPYVVGAILEQQTGKRINSYNGGLSGNNSLHAIDLLVNKVIPLEPRVVVFMENINDLSTLLYKKTYWSSNNVRAPLETLEKGKLLGKLLKELLIPQLNEAYRNFKGSVFSQEEDEFAQDRGRKLTVDPAGLAREFARNLEVFVDICRDRDITPVLMTQANRVTANPDPVVAAYIGKCGRDTEISYRDFKRLYDLFNETIREVGRKKEVLVIDLAREVPPDKEHLYDLVHFNDAGSRYAANIIAAQLKPLLY